MASLCDESRTPISCHCAYTGAGGKPDCFDLAHGAYEVRPADAYRRSFWPAAHLRVSFGPHGRIRLHLRRPRVKIMVEVWRQRYRNVLRTMQMDQEERLCPSIPCRFQKKIRPMEKHSRQALPEERLLLNST